VLPVPGGHRYGVDHGLTFHEDPKLRTVLWGWAGSTVDRELLTDLEKLAQRLDGEFGNELRAYITGAEVAALRARITALLARPVMPRPLGDRRIPWPAF
jgi:uncharacterized repeat protein (TIGR03843 family)